MRFHAENNFVNALILFIRARKILEHLGLWVIPPRPPRQGRGPPVIVELALSEVEGLVYADSQVIEYVEVYYIPEYL